MKVERPFKAVFLVRAVSLSLCLLMAVSAARAMPMHLKCNYRDSPMGIDTMQPRLSWQSVTAEKNWKQVAYRLLVATRPALLKGGKPDVWDSGKVASDASVNVAYAGPALKSRQRYFWTVEVWGGEGSAKAVAQPAWWEMGLLQPADWSAQWVTRPVPDMSALRWVWVSGADALRAEPKSTAAFRYDFELGSMPARALLSAAVHGNFVVTVNGKETGRKKEWTSFDVEDIVDALRVGKNEILIDVTAAPKGRKGTPTENAVIAGVAAVVTLTDGKGSVRRIFAGKDWKGKTATGDWAAVQDVGALEDARMGPYPWLPPQPASLMREPFGLTKAVKSARLYVTAAGAYTMSLNGHRVGKDELTPDFTDYRKHVSYQTYDVRSLLTPGANILGAVLGDGWYASPMTWAGSHVFAPPVRLMAQLEIDFSDGTRQVVGTSPDWKVSDSAILTSDMYAGEMYDARLEQSGWDTAAFKAVGSGWQNAEAIAAPQGAVSAQIGAPVHVTSTITPTSVTPLANGDVVFDMGQNMVGWATLRVAGPAGTRVKMRFAERITPDGSIYTENLRNAEATDIYTLRGGGPEVYSPHFTFHGFKYVQVSGLPGKVTTAMLTGDVLNSLDAEPTGKLKTSSELLNRMWEIGIWGQRGNFLSIPTDCPQRDERLGWMGDAGVFWRTGAYNFDIAAFTQKFMLDIVDAQTSAGAFMNVSPDILPPNVGAPGWADAGVIVPYTAWLQYGDRGLIEQNWAAMERYMDFIERANPNFLRAKEVGPNYGDWLAPDQGTPKALAATAYWAIIARMMEEMAHANGHDEHRYSVLFDHLRDAYQKAYVSADGKVTGDTQTGYLLTLYAGLAPDRMRADMAQRLVANIHAHDGHLTTGFLGTPFLLFVLTDNGKADEAYKLLMQETYPSWGYMLSKGATTWWERWNGDTGDPAMNSYNHYSFGSVVAWMYRDMAGIDTVSGEPGFKHVVIKPRYTSTVSFVDGEYDSMYGPIKTHWTRTAAGTDLSVTLPPNTTATVWLENEVAGLPRMPRTREIGSGTYQFQIRRGSDGR